MNVPPNRFAVSRTTIKLGSLINLEPDDVGVIEANDEHSATIYFIRIWQRVSLKNGQYDIFDVRLTGDAGEKKVCNICHKLLLTKLFARNQNGVNNRPIRRPSCNNCRRLLDGMRLSTKHRTIWRVSKPVNVPFECPICKKRTIAGVTSKVVLDHDHVTGEPRAWICDSCNTGIGRFKDDVAILQRAIEFLG